jgi:hypothetical protein
MALSSGHRLLRRWAKEIHRDVARVVLCAEAVGTHGEDVAEWSRATEGEGEDARLGFADAKWADAVWELATEDAASRGRSTQYTVRAFNEGDSAPRTRAVLNVVVTRAQTGAAGEDDVKLDGSVASMLAQAQRGQAEALKATMDMVKLVQGSAAATNQLVSQMSTRLREQEETISKLVDLRTSEKLELTEQITQLVEARKQEKPESGPFDGQFKEMWAVAAPHVAEKAMEKFGPALLDLVLKLMPSEAPAAPAAAGTNVVALAANATK